MMKNLKALHSISPLLEIPGFSVLISAGCVAPPMRFRLVDCGGRSFACGRSGGGPFRRMRGGNWRQYAILRRIGTMISKNGNGQVESRKAGRNFG